jgi:hypothetical protein
MLRRFGRWLLVNLVYGVILFAVLFGLGCLVLSLCK